MPEGPPGCVGCAGGHSLLEEVTGHAISFLTSVLLPREETQDADVEQTLARLEFSRTAPPIAHGNWIARAVKGLTTFGGMNQAVSSKQPTRPLPWEQRPEGGTHAARKRALCVRRASE